MKKTSTNGLGNEAVKLTISKIITLVITMITGMMLARFRTLDEYGTYSALLLVINLFTALLMLGLPNSINYFLARAESSEEKKHFLSVYYTLSSVFSIIVGAVLVLTVPLIENYFNNDNIGKYYYFLALYPWATTVISSLDNVLVVYKKTGMLVIYKVAYSIMMLLTVLLNQWAGFGFDAYMLTFVIVNCIFALLVYGICANISGEIKAIIDIRLIKAIFHFSIPMGMSTLVGTLSVEMDKLLIGKLMDTAELAIYTNSAKELPLTIVATSITAVLLPQIARMIKDKKTEEAVHLWGNATVLSYIIISLLVSGIFVYAEDVMMLLYSEKYLPGLSVFRIYTLILLIRCTYFGMILNSLGQTKKILFCSIVNLLLNAVLNPVFYCILGMEGPALATFTAMLLITLAMLCMTSRATNISYAKVFPWKEIAMISLINIGFAIAFWGIKAILPLDSYVGSFMESIFLGCVWSALYFVLLKKQIKDCWKAIDD